MTASRWDALLLGAAALHAGFQLTVTVLVYPSLARVPEDRWSEGHSRHSRAITPLVALVYAMLLAGCVGATLSDPGAGTLVADAGALLALGVTATLAAPTHARLSGGPDRALLRRLLAVDTVRCAGALIAVAGALVAALGGGAI